MLFQRTAKKRPVLRIYGKVREKKGPARLRNIQKIHGRQKEARQA